MDLHRVNSRSPELTSQCERGFSRDTNELGLCLGWKGQLICWREGREGKGGWGREGGEGTEGGWGERVGRGRGGEREGG